MKLKIILVFEANVSPVVIETELLPAVTVESELFPAWANRYVPRAAQIVSSVAVRLPARLRTKSGTLLKTELINANDLEMAPYRRLRCLCSKLSRP